MPPISKFLLLCILSALALVILLAGLMFGSVDYPVAQVLRTIGGGETGAVREVIWQLRIPRVFSAFACGGLLAMAGVLLQALLRNPLAEPYILGVSGGAAVAALSAMLAGLSLIAVNSAALFGALGAIGIVLVLNVASGTWNVLRLLLTGGLPDPRATLNLWVNGVLFEGAAREASADVPIGPGELMVYVGLKSSVNDYVAFTLSTGFVKIP